MLLVLHVNVIHLPIDQQEQFVFEFVDGASIDSWVEEAEFLDKKVGDRELMAEVPFVFGLGEYFDCLCVGDEGHELVADTSIKEDAGYFGFERMMFFDAVGVVGDGDEVEVIVFFDEEPFVLLDAEAVDQVETLIVVPNIHILYYLTTHADVVDLAFTQANNHSFLLLLSLQNGNTEQIEALLHLIPSDQMSVVVDHSVLLQIEDHDLCRLILLALGFDEGAKQIEVVCEGHDFEVFLEGDFGFAYDFHGEFVVEIDVVVFLLYDVGVVVGVEEDEPDVLKDDVGGRFDFFDLPFNHAL